MARTRRLAASAGIVLLLVLGGWLLVRRSAPPGTAKVQAAGHSALPEAGVELERADVPAAEDPPAVAPEPAVAEARVALEVARLRGGVYEEGTGVGLEGFRVELARAGDVLARAASGADGRFSFAAPGVACVLRLVLPDECEAEPDRLDVDPERLLDEYAFLVRRVPSAPASGRMVDSRTGEPVPFLEFLLAGDGRVWHGAAGKDEERLETDAAGCFRSERAYAGGHLSLRVAERGEERRMSFGEHVFLRHDPGHAGGALQDVPIDVGPTYRLALELPPEIDPDDLEAELGGVERSTNPFSSGLSGTRRTRVREGDPPWVRFSRPELFREPAPPWKLSVRTTYGGWRGSAEVDSMTGVYPRPVRIRLEAIGALEGMLAGAEGERVFVHLTEEGGEARRYGPFEGASYRIDWLDPGTYRLLAETRTGIAPPTGVSVAAGGVAEVDLVLGPRPTAGALAGVVISEAGKSYRDLELYLQAEGRPHLSWNVTVAWEGDRGSFRVEDLPAGEYVARLWSGSGARTDPALLLASPPDEGLSFTIRDGVDSAARFALEAVDAESGARIRGVQVAVRASPEDEARLVWTTGHGLSLGGGTLPGERFEWRLECEGYERAWGDETSFEHAPEVEPGVRRLVLELRRGWSGRVRACTEAGEPLAGVSVSFDAGPPLETGPDGRLVHRAPVKPARVDVRRPGWRITSGDVDPATGAFADPDFEITVVMAEER